MKTATQLALAILDAGKAVRIAEADLADLPVKPPWQPPTECPSDPKEAAKWEQRKADYELARGSWEKNKRLAEEALERAAIAYLDALAAGTSHDARQHLKKSTTFSDAIKRGR